MTEYTPKFGDVLQYKNGNTALMVTNYYPFSKEIDFIYLSASAKSYRASLKYFSDYIGDIKFINRKTLKDLKESYGFENKQMLRFYPIEKSIKDNNENNDINLSEKIESEQKMTTLYEIPSKTKSGKSRFGTKLATNSNGEIVLEIKGTNGSVEAFDPKTITEVAPYTVSAYDRTGSTFHYTTEKNSVKVGDIIMIGNNIDTCIVIRELDTKSKKPITTLKGIKILTEKL